MNDTYNKALAFVLKWEGGYVNNPSDTGGATNKGVTQRVYDTYRQHKKLAKQSVKLITNTEVSDIYYNEYWLTAKCDTLSKQVAVVAFDTAVNMGVGRVAEFLKESGNNPDKFIQARENKYKEFAKVPSQTQFLKGWLNRTEALKTFIKTV